MAEGGVGVAAEQFADRLSEDGIGVRGVQQPAQVGNRVGGAVHAQVHELPRPRVRGPTADDQQRGGHHPPGVTAGLLTLMFRWDLVDLSEPELARASQTAFDQLTDLVAAAQAEGWQPGFEPRRLAAALWSAVHGLVSLWVPGALQRPTGATDLAEILDPLLAIVVYPDGGSQ